MKKKYLLKADLHKYGFFTKIFRIMRISAFFLFIGILQVFASESYSQATRLTLSMSNTTIQQVLEEIEAQSEFYILFNHQLVDVGHRVNIEVSDKKIGNILTALFKDTDVVHQVMGRQIILSPKNILDEGVAKIMRTQKAIEVRGTIVDENGEPLPGVNIVVKGTLIGTITDLDGNFIIGVDSPDEILVISIVGYLTQEVTVGNQTQIDVTLAESLIELDEVVVIGYGTQKKATLTGSIVSIKATEIVKAPGSNMAASLQGSLPGLTSMQRSGAPGNDLAAILIRGQNTTGNNAPLVLVDGIPQPDWQRLNGNDIESISVLKDAAAAIYGVQAANGVILITTKRGKTGKPLFQLSINQGFITPTNLPKMASSAMLAEYSNDYLERTGSEPMYTEAEIQKFRDGSDPINYPNASWMDESLKSVSMQHQSNLSVRGGSENIKYSLSGSFLNQDDMIKKGIHNMKNYTIRTNLDAKVNKLLSVSLDLNAGLDNRMAPYDPQIGSIIVNPPTVPVYWPGGYPSNPPSDQGQHPLINNTGGSGYNNRIGKRWSGKLGFDLKIPIVKGLGMDGYFNYREETFTHKVWSTPWTYYGWDQVEQSPIPLQGGYDTKANLRQEYNNYNSNLVNLRVKFERQFNDHYFNTFIAVEQSKGYYNNFSAYRRDFISTTIDELFAGSDVNQNTGGSSSENARRNLFGRLSYNFKEKYLLDVNFRYDGSYRFPKDSRWGFFPGVSAAWRVTQEDFLKDNNIINELKIRASYGEIGNDQIAPFQYLQGYSINGVGYFFGNPSAPSAVVYGNVSPNPNVTWEVASITNVGLDGQLFGNMLGFTVDVFKQRRSNILTTRDLAVPAYTGLVLPSENIGIVENKGIELSLTHRNTISSGKGFSYLFSGNFAFARNNVVDIAEAEDVPEYQKREGHILGAGLYYEALGIIRTQEQLESIPVIPGTIVGDLYYKDINEDGTITALDRERIDKSHIPEITYGFNISAGYANFSLFAHFSGVARSSWFLYEIARTVRNAPEELLANRYTVGSMDSKYPWIPTWEPNTEVSGMLSTFWLQNSSFLRLKTLELSYNVSADLLSRINVSTARVFVSGSNLFTITSIERGYDPEGANDNQRYGGAHFYPQQRVFNLGVQITF
jgi:TonB-linked SusC/RagA family outer membrane protein